MIVANWLEAPGWGVCNRSPAVFFLFIGKVGTNAYQDKIQI
jgi:hypothetical protein